MKRNAATEIGFLRGWVFFYFLNFDHLVLKSKIGVLPKKKPTLFFVLFITDVCNLDCKKCFDESTKLNI